MYNDHIGQSWSIKWANVLACIMIKWPHRTVLVYQMSQHSSMYNDYIGQSESVASAFIVACVMTKQGSLGETTNQISHPKVRRCALHHRLVSSTSLKQYTLFPPNRPMWSQPRMHTHTRARARAHTHTQTRARAHTRTHTHTHFAMYIATRFGCYFNPWQGKIILARPRASTNHW